MELFNKGFPLFKGLCNLLTISTIQGEKTNRMNKEEHDKKEVNI